MKWAIKRRNSCHFLVRSSYDDCQSPFVPITFCSFFPYPTCFTRLEMSQSCTRFLAPALVDPLTLPPDGALDSAPWLHQTLQKSSHHDQTTGWPRLRGNVSFTRSSQYNPLVCIGSSRYSIPLWTGSSARTRNASFTDNPSVRLPSFHPFMYIRLPLYLFWFTHKPTIFTIPERSIHTHRRFRLLLRL